MADLFKTGGSAGETASLTFTDAGALSLLDSAGSAGGVKGDLRSDQFVLATISGAGGSGGATAGTLAVAVKQADNATTITSARQLLILVSATQYQPGQTSSTVTFSSATTGTLVASGNGYALIETSAAGAFACTISNSADGTFYVSAITPWGVSDLAKACGLLASNSAALTWAA
jgi:hypothetical protein